MKVLTCDQNLNSPLEFKEYAGEFRFRSEVTYDVIADPFNYYSLKLPNMVPSVDDVYEPAIQFI